MLFVGSFGFTLFSIVMMVSCISIASERGLGLVFVYALFAGVTYASRLIGQGLAAVIGRSSLSQETQIVTSVFVLLYGCSLVMFILVRKSAARPKEAAPSGVDVNYGQLAWKLRQDPRVAVFERVNIKLADPAELGAPFDVLVADLSFIGLAALAPTFARFSQPGTVFIGLVKPQFESRPDETEHGVVRDEAVRRRTVDEVRAALVAAGFGVAGVVESPITGPEGNVEYLVRAVFEGSGVAD